MKRYRILMADEDISYLSKIELMLLREYGEEIDLELITDADYLDKLFRSPQQVDILVIHEDFWKEEFRRQNIHHIFFLTESENGTNSIQGITNIYKYSSVQNVVHTINIVLKRLVQGGENKLEKKVVMVYSPQGGSGKTTIALGAAKALFQLGNHVLYVNTESIQGPAFAENVDKWADRSLIQALSVGRYSKEILENNIEHGDVDCLLPFQYSLVGNGLKDMNYLSLIQAVKNTMPYDIIIVDTSNDFNDFKAQMMSYADQVIIPCLQDEQSAYKVDALLRNINVSDKNKYIFVCNKFQIGVENRLSETTVWQMFHHRIPLQEDGKEDGIANGFMEIAYSLI
ncbi:MAG: AAA family ATPase [Lachnospiraceae bacterium]|nr:AAA family ATPase [Lachnospiraceae bacterium]